MGTKKGLDLYEGVVKHVLYRLSGILVIDQNHLGVDLLSSRQTRAKRKSNNRKCYRMSNRKKRLKNNNWIDPRRLIILVLVHQTRMIVSRPSWPLSQHRSNSFILTLNPIPAPNSINV